MLELVKLQELFACEAHRAVGSKALPLPFETLKLMGELSSDSEPAEGSEDEWDILGVRKLGKLPAVNIKRIRTVKLAGVVAAPDGSKTVSVPGHGRGVPPSADLLHSAVITLHPERPPIVLTGANDGENMLWAPAMGWDRLGTMPFYSVNTRLWETTPGAARRPEGRPSPRRAATARGAARAEMRREAENVRREQEAKLIQDTHLDPEREIFISKEMYTTVVHPLDFEITERIYAELEDKRLLFDLPDPMDAQTQRAIPNTPRALLEAIRSRKRQMRPRTNVAASAALRGTIPEGGAAGGQLISPPGAANASSRRRSTMLGEAMGHTMTAVPSTPRDERSGAHRFAMLPAAPAPRGTVRLTCLAVHPQIPRLLAGIGDGQLAVYHVYREHGQRRPQLHQTQGFDASRRCGDTPTAAYVPTGPLAQEGALNSETIVAGFESGRVAVFKVLLPEALRGGRSDPNSETADDNGSPPTNSEVFAHRATKPVLTAQEPLLLEHYHCKCPIQALLWHPILGIVSIGTDGTVIMVDTSGAVTCSIAWAAGKDAVVNAADLSTEHEQLAVAGQRGVHLWQCFSQAKLGVLEPPGAGVKKSTTLTLLARYLPSERYLVSVHELRGEVRVWDVLLLELVYTAFTPDCPRATCAAFDSAGMMVLVFGPSGVSEQQLVEVEEEIEEEVPVKKVLAVGSSLSQTQRWTLVAGAQGTREEDWARFSAIMRVPAVKKQA